MPNVQVTVLALYDSVPLVRPLPGDLFSNSSLANSVPVSLLSLNSIEINERPVPGDIIDSQSFNPSESLSPWDSTMAIFPAMSQSPTVRPRLPLTNQRFPRRTGDSTP